MPRTKKLGAETVEKEPKASKKPEALDYQIEITVNGQTFLGEGATLHEALKTFVAPDAIKTETLIRVTRDGVTTEKEINVTNARRAFGGSNVALELLAANLSKFLG